MIHKILKAIRKSLRYRWLLRCDLSELAEVRETLAAEIELIKCLETAKTGGYDNVTVY